MEKIIQQILDKILSGRFVLVIAAAYVFVKLRGTLPKELIASLLTMVFTLYFTRDRQPPANGGIGIVK